MNDGTHPFSIYSYYSLTLTTIIAAVVVHNKFDQIGGGLTTHHTTTVSEKNDAAAAHHLCLSELEQEQQDQSGGGCAIALKQKTSPVFVATRFLHSPTSTASTSAIGAAAAHATSYLVVQKVNKRKRSKPIRKLQK